MPHKDRWDRMIERQDTARIEINSNSSKKKAEKKPMKRAISESPTFGIIKAALAHTEEILRKEYERQLLAQYDRFVVKLAADDMDARKSYDYPNSLKLDRKAYRMQLAQYQYCQKHSTPDYDRSGRRGMHDPDFRLVHPSKTIPQLKAKAIELAKEALIGYCLKLSMKIDETKSGTIQSAEYKGGLDPWSDSFVNVTTANGKQVWKTRMIINVSCLGTLFNQWPTRLMK